MKTVLVTAFEPFDGEAINPSWEAVKVLQGREIAGARVMTCQLACVFDLALQQLNAALAEHQPDCVLAVGQAGGRAEITVERVAININDACIPDNHGKQPIDTPVIAGGPDAYFSTLPIKLMVNALREQGIPASVSHTAGTFVCNHVMYGLLHALALRPGAASGGFVHIPYAPQQAARHPGEPSMPIAMVTEALVAMIAVAVTQQQDAMISGGTTH
ncbi:pyroglutamyl-peptidase I [Candidatus Symbiopectobacterium sp. 'North America']|uniref:pyroglutamyl-peptidase I n=1 Tax=Candidatus Symbiopectobacterium sp. 'North America' TaxID=2794574 RepID=UPI0018CA4BB8|nr:pyroglutamyl-peptidase I [Candidatus Symbiopectobacterium sp. 'North America']MBG6244290.1 pyroglutamyl-peptidase I [Candidatus Symbiopectobacterium sp. 'North America']